MIKLVLVRHGESIWNLENKFTGWTDVGLSEDGIIYAKQAGKILYENGFDFDIVYTSVLKRAIDTLNYLIHEMKDIDLTIKRSYKLNERHYGALQGLNKKETADKYGSEQVRLWRRGYDVKPPALTTDDPRYPGNDPLYRNLDKSKLPLTESLKDTVERVVEYYNDEIKPNLLNGKSIMIVAHGNSLRGLIKYLDNISDEDIMNVEIPTGIPLVYELADTLKPIRHYYLEEKNKEQIMEYMTLNNGIKMPTIGIGTFMLMPNTAENSVYEALKMGYRLIDTANAYVNERAVGKAIKKSKVERKEIFVSTKLWPSEYENFNAIDETLERLGLDYIDLLFLHQPAGNYIVGYKQLEKAYKEGKIKAIGISNFEGKYIEEILANCEVVPQVIQVEAHPYFLQDELRKITEAKDIKIMSWYPLGHGDKSLIEEPIITELASKYGKSNAQIILKWHIQMGFIVIPGSKNVDHIRDNFDLFDFELTDEDMMKIATLNKGIRYYDGTEEQLKNYAKWQPEYEKE